MPDELSNIATAMRNEQQIVTRLPSRKQAASAFDRGIGLRSCAFAGWSELVSMKTKSTRFKRPARTSMATSLSTANIPC